jgi:hypothetical protein
VKAEIQKSRNAVKNKEYASKVFSIDTSSGTFEGPSGFFESLDSQLKQPSSPLREATKICAYVASNKSYLLLCFI